MHMALPAHTPPAPCFAGVGQSRRLTPIISLYSSTALDIASMDYPTQIITCYHTWISQWHHHMKETSTAIQVSPQDSHIHTLLNIHRWQEALVKHPHQPLVSFFLIGISQGFSIGFNHSPDELKSACRNFTGALQHPHKLWKNTWPQKFFITVLLPLSKRGSTISPN